MASVYIEPFSLNYSFKYVGSDHTTSTPYEVFLQPGTYIFEAWGAQGGSTIHSSCSGGKCAGGKGGYTSGIITLKRQTKFFIFIGSEGSSFPNPDYHAFNGGGKPISSGGGGGATDFRLLNGNQNNIQSINSRVLVAGGGGGSDNRGYGGAGGGIVGGSSTPTSIGFPGGTGGTQTNGGKGQVNGSLWSGGTPTFDTCGGGGGYYGGGSGESGNINTGAGGGSGYISGHPECIKHSSGIVFKKTLVLQGIEESPSLTNISEFGHEGNGAARITLIPNIMCSSKIKFSSKEKCLLPYAFLFILQKSS